MTGEPGTVAQVNSGVPQWIDVVFDGAPGYESGRFIEVENIAGESVHAGEWQARRDGTWVLRMLVVLPAPHVRLETFGETDDVLAPVDESDTATMCSVALCERGCWGVMNLKRYCRVHFMERYELINGQPPDATERGDSA